MFGNPGNSSDLTAAAIASAIGADNSGQAVRLVDNKPVAYSGSADLNGLTNPGVTVLNKVDVSTAVMISLNLQNIVAPNGSTPLATAPSGTMGFDLVLSWYDPTGTVLLTTEAFEINCPIRPSVGQVLVYSWQATLPARGALLTITAANPLGTFAAVAGGGFALTLNTSSRVIPARVRGWTDQGALDGLLGNATGTLAANASNIIVFPPTTGRIFLSRLGASVQLRMDVAFGLARTHLHRSIETWAASNAASVPLEFPSTNRPLSLQITNLSTTTSGQYNVSAWTNPN